MAGFESPFHPTAAKVDWPAQMDRRCVERMGLSLGQYCEDKPYLRSIQKSLELECRFEE
jgi:hypothetical protein